MGWVRRPIKIFSLLAALCLLASSPARADFHFFDIGTKDAPGQQWNYCANTGVIYNKNNGGDDSKTGISYIASTVICEFVTTLDIVLVKVYTGIQSALLPVVQAALTLYIAIFGAQLVMGTAQLQAREIVTRLLKIAGVWLFATSWAYGASNIFYFYMGFIADAGGAIVNTLVPDPGGTSTVCPNYQYTDGSGNPHTGIDYPNITGDNDPSATMPLFNFFDELISCALLGPASAGGIKIVGFFMAMMLVYPPMFVIFSWWLQTTAFALARALLTYLTGISAIAFLIGLSPIFLSMMLFETTRQVFDNWIRYLISYSVQIIIVLGIIVMWVLVLFQLVYFFTDMANLVFPLNSGPMVGGYLHQTSTWGLCDAVYDPDDPLYYTENGVGHPLCRICNGKPCNPVIDTNNNDCNGDAYCLETGSLIPPTKIINQAKSFNKTSSTHQEQFLEYVFSNLVALLMLSYAFSMLLEKAHEISSGIAGAGANAPAEPGGWGMRGFGSATTMKAAPGPAPVNAGK